MGAKSKRKGKVGERELAGELSRLFGVDCRRGVQYSGLGGDDVVGLPGVHVECKRTERLTFWEALQQAVADAEARNPPEVPIVAHRANGKPWVVVVRLDDLPALVDRLPTSKTVELAAAARAAVNYLKTLHDPAAREDAAPVRGRLESALLAV